MAYSAETVKNMNVDTLKMAIEKCNKNAADAKETKPSRAKKFENLGEVYQNAKTKLEKTINFLEKTNDPSSTTTPKQKYIETICDGKRANLTLAWIGSQCESKGVDLSSAGINLADDSDITPKNVRRSIFDIGKDCGSNLVNGKGKAVGLAYGLLGVSIADAATKGVTTLLAKKGIMSESLNLFGLVKKGVLALKTSWPSIMSNITTGATAVWGAVPLAVCTFGAFALLKLVPVIKRKVQQLNKKAKGLNVEKNLEDSLDDAIAKQPDPSA